MKPTPGHRSHWSDPAACKGSDTEEFFPNHKGPAPSAVVRTCYDCPIKYECRLAGYAESYGWWGNSHATERNRSRMSIFGRVYASTSFTDEDNLEGFRGWVNAILKKTGALHDRLSDAGLNDREIGMFFQRTEMDNRGAKYMAKQSGFTTDEHWMRQYKPKAGRVGDAA